MPVTPSTFVRDRSLPGALTSDRVIARIAGVYGFRILTSGPIHMARV
jgi:hypothetical protein